ncbi:MAG: hypothetical protein IPF98_18235 [Gemmatimonadetes bacterium]|nr:hypothetical protein [Gemmatimonadota bacterium]MCC6772836.1 hypothetical protein [Gemmatimonadaceae bacterium]
MSPTIRLLLRGTKFLVLGALTGALLGLVTFLPGELVATADLPSGSTVAWPLAFGVAWVSARVGAVVGVIFFLIRRTLMGEVADPRVVTPPSPPTGP